MPKAKQAQQRQTGQIYPHPGVIRKPGQDLGASAQGRQQIQRRRETKPAVEARPEGNDQQQAEAQQPEAETEAVEQAFGTTHGPASTGGQAQQLEGLGGDAKAGPGEVEAHQQAIGRRREAGLEAGGPGQQGEGHQGQGEQPPPAALPQAGKAGRCPGQQAGFAAEQGERQAGDQRATALGAEGDR